MSSPSSSSIISINVTERGGQSPLKDVEIKDAASRAELERALVRKIDVRMSILVLIYIVNYLDRSNVASARLEGFEADLGLHGDQFATVLSVLYAGYILMQVPSNIYLNKIGRPSLYLTSCMVIWGIICTLMGHFSGAVLIRFFLGFVEAAFFPGALFLLSRWYKRDELGLRTAIFYSGLPISNSISGLIASGILSRMEGVLGRWLFYIEGSATCLIALIAIPILPDFPHNTRWLSPSERALAMQRMEEDVGVEDNDHENLTFDGFFMAIRDWKVWWMALTVMLCLTSLSFNGWFPTLTATLGYNLTVTLLLCAPPWAVTVIVAFLWTRHSDKTGERVWHITISFSVAVTGFIIAMCTMNTAARYISLFLMALAYPGQTCLYTWISDTFARPPAKRAAALAFVSAMSNIGSIAAGYMWPSSWGPSYAKSYGICIACAVGGCVCCWTLRAHLQQKNRKGTGGFVYLL
ncbi:MFS general substrate transporter [Fistulina hepatica ATCC 64428]|uniref:MFS general substrate transporter n=1 Tax=Fistulina hepatica ATCC 64428 TaxID=1128425 RepID=A0A0D7AJM8_9AGAR|nr:MFS general substrate transporter [Fistulina hepatica ATCC 64428]